MWMSRSTAAGATDGLPTASSAALEAGGLGRVQPELRQPLVSGMRWTVWLSALAIPFTYGTRILLARLGPEALGTYGLLLVYVGLVSTLLFLGGNAVAIRFLPLLSAQQRVPFLLRYLGVIAVALAPWLLWATVFPAQLRLFFGSTGGWAFQRDIIWLAPLYILFSLALSVLRGVLAIGLAQVLNRMVTIGSFCSYAVLFWVAPQLLRQHVIGLVWGIYLGWSVLATLLAILRLRRRLLIEPSEWQWKGSLPRGFWRYTLSLHGNSVLGFFVLQLDSVLVVRAGGLRVLGAYTAVMTVALFVPTMVRVLLESLLPSLTNAIAVEQNETAGALCRTYLRLMMPGALLWATGAVLLARLVLAVLGPAYQGLELLLAVAVVISALQPFTLIAGTILSAIGKPEATIAVRIVRTLAYVPLFVVLWAHLGVSGAVYAWAVAELLNQAGTLYFLRREKTFPFPYLRTYLASAAALAVAVVLACTPLVWVLRAVCIPAALALFWLLAGYSLAEARSLFHVLIPRASGV